MADTKITGLTANTAPIASDIMPMVDDPGGSALTQKVTMAVLKALFNDIATDALWDAAGDIVQGTGANTAARLPIGTAHQVPRVNAGATALEYASLDNWQFHMTFPQAWPALVTAGTWVGNYWNDTYATGYGYGFWNSSGTQNDKATWNILLSPGTWTIALHVRKSTNTGIATVQIDGSSVGTLDTYAGGVSGARLTLAGVAITGNIQHTLSILAATKHASSAGYYIELMGMDFLRTA